MAYNGTKLGQDSRFKNPDNEILSSMKIPKIYKTTIKKENIVILPLIKLWVNKKINDMLEFEDETLTNLIINLIKSSNEKIDPKNIQYQISGFLGNNTYLFMKEFWKLLINVQELYMKDKNSIPEELIPFQEEYEKRKQFYQSNKRKNEKSIKDYDDYNNNSNINYNRKEINYEEKIKDNNRRYKDEYLKYKKDDYEENDKIYERNKDRSPSLKTRNEKEKEKYRDNSRNRQRRYSRSRSRSISRDRSRSRNRSKSRRIRYKSKSRSRNRNNKRSEKNYYRYKEDYKYRRSKERRRNYSDDNASYYSNKSYESRNHRKNRNEKENNKQLNENSDSSSETLKIEQKSLLSDSISSEIIQNDKKYKYNKKENKIQ